MTQGKEAALEAVLAGSRGPEPAIGVAKPSASVPLPARAQLILNGPITLTLLRLTVPNVLLMAVSTVTSWFDAYFVGMLGSEALAGISLVYPAFMLMITMSAGGMGGAVSSAVARALGAGRRADADALAAHALVIAAAMAMLFTAGFLWGGSSLYQAMGGQHGVTSVALAYSNVIFAGAATWWLLNTLGSILRGSGNMAVPATLAALGAIVQVVLAPFLIFGWGPLPRLGVPGAGVSAVFTSVLVCLLYIAYFASGRSIVRLRFPHGGFQPALFWEILRVGIPGLLSALLTNLNMMLLAGLAGSFGTVALAGYGPGARLEYILIPLVFGLGSAMVPMVGMSIGAGQIDRARRVTWIGAGLAAVVTGSVGVFVAIFPHAWLGMFTADVAVLEAGAAYLRIVGPAYPFFGLGLALYFASQGAGRLTWPLMAGFGHLAAAAGGGWIAIHFFGAGLAGLFVAIMLGLVVYGGAVALAVRTRVFATGSARL